MNREEITLLGFEIVAFAGDARSRLMEALAAAQKGDYAKAGHFSFVKKTRDGALSLVSFDHKRADFFLFF